MLPDPRPAAVPSGMPPFSSAPFDGSDNERAGIEPSTVNFKKTPIVPEFDN
jgi:hypothetical protein